MILRRALFWDGIRIDGARTKLQLTILGGSRSADTLSLPEPELSLASWASPPLPLDRRLLVFPVLNGLPDTIAFSNFCTSSGKKKVSITLCPLGVTAHPAPLRARAEREFPALAPYSHAPPYQGH
jgi:hypothetical protein